MTLNRIPDEVIDDIIQKIDEVGYFNDENTKVGFAVKSPGQMIKQLDVKGVIVEKLDFRGHYYEGYGAVYYCFDKTVMDYIEARKLTDKWVEENSDC